MAVGLQDSQNHLLAVDSKRHNEGIGQHRSNRLSVNYQSQPVASKKSIPCLRTNFNSRERSKIAEPSPKVAKHYQSQQTQHSHVISNNTNGNASKVQINNNMATQAPGKLLLGTSAVTPKLHPTTSIFNPTIGPQTTKNSNVNRAQENPSQGYEAKIGLTVPKTTTNAKNFSQIKHQFSTGGQN